MAFIRARDIEDIIRNRGMERGTVHVLQTLAEQQRELMSNQRELGDLINSMMDIIPALVTVGEGMKSTIEKLNSDAAHAELGHNTQSLSESDGS